MSDTRHTAHEHWEDLRRTFSAATYEQMLENHALTDEQRQQLMKMRDRRARIEAETRFTEEQTKAYLRDRSRSSAALLAAREQMDAMRPPRVRATTGDVLHDLEAARSDYDRLSHEASLSAELERVQQHLVELRAELGVPPPIQDDDHDDHDYDHDEGILAAPPPPIDVVRPQVAGRVSDGPRGLRVLDAGVGGFPELVESLADDLVQFGVLRFELGSGSFMREKFVFIQYAGPNTGAVKRGRHVGQAAMVKEAMGGAHASMVFYDRDEMTTENVLERLLSIMTADDGDFDLDQLRAMIDAQIAKAAAQADAVGDGGRHVLTAAEMRNHDFGAAECIRYVKAPAGPFNWLLLEPDATNLKLYNAGSGSVVEMVEWLDSTKVLYGLVRMAFGTGQFRRTKWVWVQWSGEEVGAIARSRAVYGGAVEVFQRVLAPYSVQLHVGRHEEVAPEIVIERIKSVIVSDGDFSDNSDLDIFSLEHFYAALAEEDAAAQELFADEVIDEGGGPYGTDGTWDGMLTALRGPHSPINWMVAALP